MMTHRFENYINLQKKTEDYSTGDLVVTNTTVSSFYGAIKEERSPAYNSGINAEGRLRDKRIIKITARYWDTLDVTIDSELTFDDFEGTFTVFDKYDDEFKRTVCIMAQRTA